ncbi:MAG: epoxyqueuosine reductase QueH [Treponema sp.]|nr:epoxyqueuosine reductase QueH [Treponema sp.]
MKLLLHCCCAPCSLSCVNSLREKGMEPELYWYNPNIHPYTEYKARRDCLALFAANENLKLEMSDEYALRLFLNLVLPAGEKRCEKCYTLRLEKTAFLAAQKGFQVFSTSLLISPYQDHDAIKRIGEQAAAKHDLEFYYSDFRHLFREGQSVSRARGLYMQKYCGCIFSEEERYVKRNGDGC